jgi:hypothetical protein
MSYEIRSAQIRADVNEYIEFEKIKSALLKGLELFRKKLKASVFMFEQTNLKNGL